MMGKVVLIPFLLIMMRGQCQSENIGIGTQNPDNSAILDISSQNKGLLIPRLSTSQRSNISSTGPGLIVYDTNLKNLVYHNGLNWIELTPFPKGSIIMWGGDEFNTPRGWRLCDGTNGTPDLSGKFIVGYDPSNSDYNSIGREGGYSKITLTLDQIPSHNHSISGSHSHTAVSNEAHSHSFSYSYQDLVTGGDIIPQGGGKRVVRYNESFPLRPTIVRNNTISVNSSVSNVTLQNSGGNQFHENRPKYYVLAFIMKL